MLLLVLTCVAITSASELFDDFHYPAEEPSEFAAATLPTVRSVNAQHQAADLISADGTPQQVKVGDVAFGVWHVMGIVSESSPSVSLASVVLEREFARWGMLAFVPARPTPPVVLRKSIGRLDAIRQPTYNFTAVEPDYFNRSSADLDDFPSVRAQNLTRAKAPDDWREARFGAIASTLAPQRDIVAVSTAADVVKFAVTHHGRVKCFTQTGSAGRWRDRRIAGRAASADQ
jgi:hypothetical protein